MYRTPANRSADPRYDWVHCHCCGAVLAMRDVKELRRIVSRHYQTHDEPKPGMSSGLRVLLIAIVFCWLNIYPS